MILAKHRNGPTDTVKLTFRKESISFLNLASTASDDEPRPVNRCSNPGCSNLVRGGTGRALCGLHQESDLFAQVAG